MRVIGYIRCSTGEQATGGVTLDAQRSKVEQFARLHDLELVEVVADAGVSGKSLDRPGLTVALDMLASGAVEGIVVAKLDRLSRSVGDWNRLIDEYFGDRAGRTLMSVGDSIDTRRAAGRLVLNVLMSVAQWERETIVERTCDALQHKRSRGERIGHVPYGWRLREDGRSLVPEPREQEARALIAAWRAEHKPLRWIGAELIARGFTPRSGAASWSPSVIRHIALNTDTDTTAAAVA